MLGTGSQAPTVDRSQMACLLRWGDTSLLFDAGEGAQRQLARAKVSANTIDRICLTHFHGDHCLGLPGVIMRRTLDGSNVPIPVHYPASGERYFDRLRYASEGQEDAPIVAAPITGPGVVVRTAAYTLSCATLSHSVDTIGYRLVEHDSWRFVPERLAELGIRGSAIGQLRQQGRISHRGRTVEMSDVADVRRGQVFAFVMDTRWCAGALELAAGADLLVCESTFLSGDADLAERYGHLTAQQAGRLARVAGARRLVLSHFSRRYPDPALFASEAGAEFDDVVVPRDLDRIAFPQRS
ncbi:MAG: ribonuclease Z [Ilumatobacter sp.]|jgi:ribonuclease Z